MTRHSRRIITTVAVLLLGLGMVATQPTSAAWSDGAALRSSASTEAVGAWQPWYGQIRLSGTQLCVDVPSRTTTEGTDVQLYACNSTPAQIWAFQTDDSLRVYASVGRWLPNDNPTPMCLQGNRGRFGLVTSASIESCPTSMPADQQWVVSAVSNGFQIRNVDLDRCLDVPSSSQSQGTFLELGQCGANNRARVWLLEPVTTVGY